MLQRLKHSSQDRSWDIQWVDEFGRLIWGADLAKRYRDETTPRAVNNQLRRWL